MVASNLANNYAYRAAACPYSYRADNESCTVVLYAVMYVFSLASRKGINS